MNEYIKIYLYKNVKSNTVSTVCCTNMDHNLMHLGGSWWLHGVPFQRKVCPSPVGCFEMAFPSSERLLKKGSRSMEKVGKWTLDSLLVILTLHFPCFAREKQHRTRAVLLFLRG